MSPERPLNLTTRDRLKRFGLTPKKSLGQNFCSDPRLVECMVSRLDIQNSDEVWEIGPGSGALTTGLVGKPGLLRLFEIDSRFKDCLEDLCGGSKDIQIHWGDVLKMDLGGINPGKGLLICGNLPYYCGTRIIRDLLMLNPPARKLVFLLQMEVVKKAAAGPGEEDFGFLSVCVQLFAKAVIGETFSPASFYPNPQVSSMIIEFLPFQLSEEEKSMRLKAVKIASLLFEQRRKMALSLLRKKFPGTLPSWEDRFKKLGLSEQIRGERISIAQYLELAEGI